MIKTNGDKELRKSVHAAQHDDDDDDDEIFTCICFYHVLFFDYSSTSSEVRFFGVIFCSFYYSLFQ